MRILEVFNVKALVYFFDQLLNFYFSFETIQLHFV